MLMPWNMTDRQLVHAILLTVFFIAIAVLFLAVDAIEADNSNTSLPVFVISDNSGNPPITIAQITGSFEVVK